MIDYLFNTQIVPLVFLGTFGFFFLVQVIFYLFFFNRLGRFRPAGKEHVDAKGITIVVCAHNEYHHLRENLPLLLEQDHPNYEVLVVNHASDDDTHFLLSELSERYPHLSTVTIHEELNFFTGKKFPLSIGIRSAKYGKVLLTDADCRPASPQWARLMESAYHDHTEIVLGYGPYIKRSGLVNRLIRFDTAHIAVQYLSYALAGIPYMGVGRNLSYRKELFYRNQGFIAHYRVRSGDDDLFVNRVARKSNTAIMTNPESYTVSAPKETLAAWFFQKRRHLSTSSLYRPLHKFLLGLYSGGLVMFYLLFGFLMVMQWSWIPVLSLFGIRMILQFAVLSGCFRRLNEKDLLPFAPVFELLLLGINGGVAMANLFSKPARWK